MIICQFFEFAFVSKNINGDLRKHDAKLTGIIEREQEREREQEMEWEKKRKRVKERESDSKRARERKTQREK